MKLLIFKGVSVAGSLRYVIYHSNYSRLNAALKSTDQKNSSLRLRINLLTPAAPSGPIYKKN